MGRAVIDELLATGYTVTCLALSDEAAAALTAKGVKVLGGSFRDFEIVKQRASKADGVIKLALNPVFSKYAQNCIDEKETIEAIGSLLVGTNKPLATTFGTLVLSHGKIGAQDKVSGYEQPMNKRAQNGKVISGLAEQNMCACVIRLSPTVHGDEDHAFIEQLTVLACSQHHAIYIDGGLSR
ncbi:Oxidoreductase, putative [Penicillium digitatum]|uniref:Oxidoreductase, putative n=3 Tax=Penicillium digitatum TaxID=36651 RepID=K9FHF0_PEND2|nr:Oxidoreductase, putative [Penicillium digitatum Pd1]EKV07305.1 Oxidoreductase, putative [Penicillium digitatum Pd1]EKV08669.1 Oxidoreductase, putative [Penicillium digitatum PHI26]QQK41126.1 Oxidoreductase, putative [Penicillium digitatum]